MTKPMKPGDRVEVEIQGIGVLRNVVKAGPALETAAKVKGDASRVKGSN